MHPFEAKMLRVRRFRYTAMAVGLIWIFFMGWSEFFIPDYEVYLQQQRFARQLENCQGNRASQRYDCKSGLLVGEQQAKFFDWGKRVAIVFAPPLLLVWLVTRLAMPKRPPPGGTFRDRPEPRARKGGEEP